MKHPTSKGVDPLQGLGDALDNLVGPRTEPWPDTGAETIDRRQRAGVHMDTVKADVQNQGAASAAPTFFAPFRLVHQ